MIFQHLRDVGHNRFHTGNIVIRNANGPVDPTAFHAGHIF